jgi:hypothetical protein
VRVAVDPSGAPFAVSATQRLVVRRLGDYYFTVGAPLTSARATAASQGPVGFRTGSLIWEGFDPGTRVLEATARLRVSAVAPSLPLRVERHAGRVVLVDATSVDVGTFTASARPTGLASALGRALHAPLTRTTVLAGQAVVTGPVRQTRIRVVAPLRVVGTVGGANVDVRLDTTRPRFATRAGAVHLEVAVAPPSDSRRGSLLQRVLRASFELARARQYDEFLANPDPSGTSRTTYRYDTRARPAAVAPAPTRHGSTGWTRTLAVAIGIAAAFVAAVVIWARS